LTAGALWGTMYIPYRKAYLTGMHPLSFVAFFTIGELGMMTALALSVSGGPGPLWGELAKSREVLFWLLLAGSVWVVGDLFQQYAPAGLLARRGPDGGVRGTLCGRPRASAPAGLALGGFARARSSGVPRRGTSGAVARDAGRVNLRVNALPRGTDRVRPLLAT